MIEVEEMEMQEVHALLERADYGHLGCVRDNHPYVIPIHYAYQDPDIYIFTTEGMKTQFIATNPEVCLQVEEVVDPTNWKSVIATGKAARLTDKEEMESAMQYITTANPSLTPALNKMWNDPGVAPVTLRFTAFTRTSSVDAKHFRRARLAARRARQICNKPRSKQSERI